MACMRPASIREKSSSVFTRRSKRIPLRLTSSSWLVADVAEESGLGTIEFGESLQAFSFLFGSAGVLNCRCHLVDEERKKREVVGVEAAGRVHAIDQDTERGFFGARKDGQNDRL